MATTILLVGIALAGCDRTDKKIPNTKASSDHDKHDLTKSTATQHQHGDTAKSHSAHLSSTKLAFSTEPKTLQAGQQAQWTLEITDAKTGDPIGEFDVVHDKLLHLIIVLKDLSWFNHIHPEHDGNGVYTIKATVPRNGQYKLYADFTPKGRAQEVIQHEFTIQGPDPLPPQPQLVADTPHGPWIKKEFISRPAGEAEGAAGSKYQIGLMA